MTTPADRFEKWAGKHTYDLIQITGTDNERTAIARFAWLAAWNAAIEEAIKIAKHEHLSNGSCCGVTIASKLKEELGWVKQCNG